MAKYFSLLGLVLTASISINAHAFSNANQPYTVSMQNATNCHTKADDSHYIGEGINSIGTVSVPWAKYGVINGIGNRGPVPIIDGIYVILYLNTTADSYDVYYKSGDKYIISYDNEYNCYSHINPGMPGCFMLAPNNPCA